MHRTASDPVSLRETPFGQKAKAKPKDVSWQPALSTATAERWAEPAALKSSSSAASAGLNCCPPLKPLSLCAGICQPSCHLAGGRTAASPGCTYFFLISSISAWKEPPCSLQVEQLKQESCRIVTGKRSHPKNLPRLRLLTPEDGS